MAKERGREWEEYDNAVRWMATTFLISLVVSIILVYLSQPIAFLLEKGISKENVDMAIRFNKKSCSFYNLSTICCIKFLTPHKKDYIFPFR